VLFRNARRITHHGPGHTNHVAIALTLCTAAKRESLVEQTLIRVESESIIKIRKCRFQTAGLLYGKT
jgi:hypothetical protein